MAASNTPFVSLDKNKRGAEIERLKTFPPLCSFNIDKADLSKNGFTYLNRSWCKCVFCGIVINLMNIITEPINAIHKRINPNCKQDEDELNKPLGNIRGDLSVENNRLATFLQINLTATLDPYDLAKRGFYWLGAPAVIKCFSCSIEIGGCERGVGVADHIAGCIMQRDDIAENDAALASNEVAAIHEGNREEDGVAQIEDADVLKCKVCYEKDLGIFYLPCGHIATCIDCGPGLASCPTCRKKLTAYARAFIS